MAKRTCFLNSLDLLEKETYISKEIEVKQILKALEGKGYPALLILFSLPCSLPVQIPGFSTPFGLFLAFLGFRLAFLKHIWWPKWVKEKKFSSAHTRTVAQKTKKVVIALQKVIKPRFRVLATNSILRRVNGLIVLFLGLLLALPLPIPLSNMLTAIPILVIALGLLEEDGIIVLIGYVLSFVGFNVF